MPSFSVSRSTTISARNEAVFSSVRDFHQWPLWSPWLIAEPSCQILVADDGNSYSWEGSIVGSGAMEVLDETLNERIDYRLTFLKPWKSVAAVSFKFKDNGDSTEVTWTMDGSLPFFMFWMVNTMKAMIGMDYQRGLNMLKDFIETGDVPSKLEFSGVGRFEGSPYLGLRNTCEIPEIGDQMDRDFKRLFTALESTGKSPSANPFSIYHKYDFVKGITEYTVGMPIDGTIEDIPDGMHVGKIDSRETYQVKHTGPYRHLGNPWAVGMMHARAKVFKENKKVPPFEVYENNPQEVAENELVTIIHLPVA